MSEPVASQSDASERIANLTEHLRSIHFAIVVASITLLMAVMYADSADADRALRDLEQLSGAGRHVLTDTNWLGAPTVRSPRTGGATVWEFRQPSGSGQRGGKASSAAAFVVLEDDALHRLSVSSVTFNKRDPRVPIATLHDLQAFWDSLPRTIYTCERWQPGPKLRLQSLPTKDSTSADSALLTPSLKSPPKLAPVYTLTRLGLLDTSRGAAYTGTVKAPRNGKLLWAHVEAGCPSTALHKISPHDSLAKLVRARWDTGAFTTAFFALNRLGVHYDLVNDSDLGNHLRKIAENGGRIEIVGLDIPATVATRWGALVLGLLMLYFWLHLEEFVRLAERDCLRSDQAWIGLFTDPIARLGCWISTAVLPMATSIMLAEAAWGQAHIDLTTARGIGHAVSILLFVAGACGLGFIINDTRDVLVKRAQYEIRSGRSGRAPLKRLRVPIGWMSVLYVSLRCIVLSALVVNLCSLTTVDLSTTFNLNTVSLVLVMVGIIVVFACDAAISYALPQRLALKFYWRHRDRHSFSSAI